MTIAKYEMIIIVYSLLNTRDILENLSNRNNEEIIDNKTHIYFLKHSS